MNLNIELPEDILVISKAELKEVLEELQVAIAKEKTDGNILTVAETAELLKVSTPTIRRWIETKEIPHFQLGQVIRFNKIEVINWFNSSVNN